MLLPPPGLYMVTFATAAGDDHGVADLQDGKLRGGDSDMALGRHLHAERD